MPEDTPSSDLRELIARVAKLEAENDRLKERVRKLEDVRDNAALRGIARGTP